MDRAETILINGIFPTVPGAEAIAFGRDGIINVGRQDDVIAHASDRTRVIDLAGAAVLPGFIDAHTHLINAGLTRIGFNVDLVGLSREQVIAALATACRARGTGEWVIGRGWDESGWSDHSYLSRAELDRVSRRNPIAAVRVDGHLLTANTIALRFLPASVPSDQTDVRTGIVREDALSALLHASAPDEATMISGLRAAARYAHTLGITSVHAMAAPNEWRPFMRTRGELDLRITLYPEVSALDHLRTLGIESGFGDKWLRIGGVKLFADGSIGARTAALHEPYIGGGRGTLIYSDAELTQLIANADAAGLQTAVHAIGDRAIEQVLRVHAQAGTNPELRHRIEHFELPNADQRVRAADLGLCASMQPNFAANWSGHGGMYETQLGPARDRHIDPHRAVLVAGIPLAFGSDCMPLSPLYGIHAAVNAPYPEQQLSPAEAIHAYTAAGAYLAGEESVKGSLAPGMYADIVVLTADPGAIPDRISAAEVLMTFVGGGLMYKKEEL